MSTTHSSSVTPMKNLAVLARLLERLDHGKAPVDAGQYRAVVQRLAAEFATADPQVIQSVLEISPEAAQLYENIHYAHAGLCRSQLDASLAAEAAARAAIGQAMQRPQGLAH